MLPRRLSLDLLFVPGLPPLLHALGELPRVRQVVLAVVIARLHSLLVDKIVDTVGGLEVVLSTSDARIVLDVPPEVLEVVPATIVAMDAVVAVQLKVFCTGRGFCRERLPGAVEKPLLAWVVGGRRLGPAVVVVAVTRTVDCPAEWCFAQPYSVLATRW